MGIEETYRKKLEGIIRGIRIGTMSIEDDNNFYIFLNRFKKINGELAEDFQERYIAVVESKRKLVS